MRAAQRNYGLYGGQWGRVGPNKAEEMAQSLRDELQAREWEAERKALQKPKKSAGSVFRFRVG